MRVRRGQLMLGVAGLVLALAALPVCTSASSDGTAGAAFLKLGTGARPAAMGGTYVGIADDVYGMHWNPAGLARLDHLQLGAQHLNQFQDITYEFVGGALPLGQRFTVGADLLMMQTEDYIRTELEDLGHFNNRDLATGLSFAAKVTDEFSLGVSARYLSQKLETASARGWAADLGAYYRPDRSRWSFGLSALNLGPDVVFERLGDPLPRVIKAGAGYRAFNDKLLLAADVSAPNDGDLYGSLGMEYWLIPSLALRAGYEINTDYGGFDAMAAGLAFHYGMFAIDYAFVPREKLGNVHRIGLRLDFDGINRTPAPAPAARRAVTVPIPGPGSLPTPAPVPLPAPTTGRPATDRAPPVTTPPPTPVPEPAAPVVTPAPAPVEPAPVVIEPVPAPVVTPVPAPIPPAPTLTAAQLAKQHYDRGVTHLRAREYAAAIAELNESLRYDPASFDTHYALSDSYYGIGDYPNALREIELARTLLR